MTEDKTNGKSKGGNKIAIVIALLAIIVIMQGIKIYLDHQEKSSVQSQLQNTEEELAITLQRLNEISRELSDKIAEVEKLGGDVSDLQAAKTEIERELRNTQQRNSKAIKDLKDRVEGYEE